MSSMNLFFTGSALVFIAFTAGWMWAKKINNYSLVDAIWALGIGIIGVFWILSRGEIYYKHAVLCLLLGGWSLRLSQHLIRRITAAHPVEDRRYVKLREHWGDQVATCFFWFFQLQAISVILLATPFFIVGMDSNSSWSSWEFWGATLCILGISGESLADSQMSRFKAQAVSPQAVCKKGLWKYSRHPNYFFEAVIWIGFYVYACGSEWGWAVFYAPLTIIYLLLKVTGIPPAEEAAVLRKGDAYRSYQATTSAFIPWFPKK